MAEPGRIIDVVCADKTGGLLGHIIDFVRNAARSDEKSNALGVGSSYASSYALIRVVPADAAKAFCAAFPQHRVRESSQFPELIVAEGLQLRNIFQQTDIECRHCIEPEQIQAGHAQMDSLDRPVVKAGNAESAAIADSLAENFPGVREIVAISPDDLRHVAKMLRLGLAKAERNS